MKKTLAVIATEKSRSAKNTDDTKSKCAVISKNACVREKRDLLPSMKMSMESPESHDTDDGRDCYTDFKYDLGIFSKKSVFRY